MQKIQLSLMAMLLILGSGLLAMNNEKLISKLLRDERIIQLASECGTTPELVVKTIEKYNKGLGQSLESTKDFFMNPKQFQRVHVVYYLEAIGVRESHRGSH